MVTGQSCAVIGRNLGANKGCSHDHVGRCVFGQADIPALDDGVFCSARRPRTMLYPANRVLAVARYQGTRGFESEYCPSCGRAAFQCTHSRPTTHAIPPAVALDRDWYLWCCSWNIVIDIPVYGSL